MKDLRKAIKPLLVLLAVGSVAAAAAPLVWTAAGHDRVIPPRPQIGQAVRAPQDPVDLGPALALAPFGSAAVEREPTQAGETTLELTLLGVIVRDDPARSMALINVAGTEANFRPGDAIGTRAELLTVARDHVTLDVDGETQILSFAGEGEPLADNVPTGAERLRALMTSGQGTTISEQVDAAQRKAPESTQDYIDMWRDRIRANPAQVLETIGLVPTDKGYMIAEEHDVGVNRAGLRAGDIVKSVNGQVVGNVEEDRDYYDVVAESGLARIEVERDGRTIVMSFPLE